MKASKQAIVTGGTRGIGAAIVRLLSNNGYVVTFTGRTKASAEAALKAYLAEGLSNLSALECDFTFPTQIEKLTQTLSKLERLDVLVNNAGGTQSAALTATSLEMWNNSFALNCTAAFELSKALLPLLEASGCGRIINIASTAGLRGYPYVAAYCAAKHALIGLTRALALEVVRKQITVNAVCPSFTETDFLKASISRTATLSKKDDDAIRTAYQAAIPLGRFITPKEVASTVLWLAQPDQSAITGQSITIAGGELV